MLKYQKAFREFYKLLSVLFSLVLILQVTEFLQVAWEITNINGVMLPTVLQLFPIYVWEITAVFYLLIMMFLVIPVEELINICLF